MNPVLQSLARDAARKIELQLCRDIMGDQSITMEQCPTSEEAIEKTATLIAETFTEVGKLNSYTATQTEALADEIAKAIHDRRNPAHAKLAIPNAIYTEYFADAKAVLPILFRELTSLHALVASQKGQIETLKQWKKEQLTVTAWWQKLYDYVQFHPDAKLGGNVSDAALQFLKERDMLTKLVPVYEGTLNEIASWSEGDSVRSSFDEPGSAISARNAIERGKEIRESCSS